MNYWWAPAEHSKRKKRQQKMEEKQTVKKEKKMQVKTLSMTCAAHAYIVWQRCRSPEDLYAVQCPLIETKRNKAIGEWWRMPHCMDSLLFVRWTWPYVFWFCSRMEVATIAGHRTNARLDNDTHTKKNSNRIYVTRLMGFSSTRKYCTRDPYRFVWR